MKTALVVLVGFPVVLTGIRARAEGRVTQAIVGLAARAGVLAGVMIAIAEFLFLLSRNCFS